MLISRLRITQAHIFQPILRFIQPSPRRLPDLSGALCSLRGKLASCSCVSFPVKETVSKKNFRRFVGRSSLYSCIHCALISRTRSSCKAIGEELWAIVEPKGMRLAPPGRDLLQHPNHSLVGQRRVHFACQAFSHPFIQNIQGSEPPTSIQRITHEVECPHDIGLEGHGHRVHRLGRQYTSHRRVWFQRCPVSRNRSRISRILSEGSWRTGWDDASVIKALDRGGLGTP